MRSRSVEMEAVARLQEAAAHKKCWSCGCFHNSLAMLHSPIIIYLQRS
jgi:hypothetical protein